MILVRALPALAVFALLSACAAPGPDAPTTVNLPDGRVGQNIYTSLQATEPPTPAQLGAYSTQLEGAGRGGLAARATAACPSGYSIVQRTAPNSRFIMTLANGVPLYKVEQTFTIACT